MKVITTPNTPDFCGKPGDFCTSKGIMVFGPNADGTFAFAISSPNDQVKCAAESFGLTKVTIAKQKCYTHKLYDIISYPNNAQITINNFYHRVCYHSADKKTLKFLKNSETLTCSLPSLGSTATGEGKCECRNVLRPADVLTPIYFAVRVSNAAFQCLNTAGDFCDGYTNNTACLAQLSGKIDPSIIRAVNTPLNTPAHNLFFNRWICPSESGLASAVKFVKDPSDTKYTVSCIGRSGDDCFYGDNAEQVCRRLNDCPDSSKDFVPLTCGTSAFKSKWFHDGFNTPQNNWCKEANAWLRFDGTISVDSTKKIGLLLNNNGANACVPDPSKPNACLVETSSNILATAMSALKADNTKLSNILYCTEKNYADARADSANWCAKSIFLPDGVGKFDIGGLNSLPNSPTNP